VYLISCTVPGTVPGVPSDWSFIKRYSQVYELHEKVRSPSLSFTRHVMTPATFAQLSKRFKKVVKLPPMPKKKIFGNTDPAFVAKRCRDLEKYLNGLAQIPVRQMLFCAIYHVFV
jgi:hypothetical protein